MNKLERNEFHDFLKYKIGVLRLIFCTLAVFFFPEVGQEGLVGNLLQFYRALILHREPIKGGTFCVLGHTCVLQFSLKENI